MGAQAHFQGKGFTPAHTTVTEGSVPVIEVLRKCFPDIKISNGVIEAGVGARSFSVKLTADENAVKLIVVANSAKQQFTLLNAPPIDIIVRCFKKEKKLRGYFINT